MGEPEPAVLEAEHVLHDAQAPVHGLSYDALAAFTEPKLFTEIPGPKARAVIEADARVTSPSLPRAYPFAPRRGAGSIVEDVDGNIFLDFNAGIAVASTGHAHPKVVEAKQYVMERLPRQQQDVLLARPLENKTLRRACAVYRHIGQCGMSIRHSTVHAPTNTRMPQPSASHIEPAPPRANTFFMTPAP